MMYDEDLSKLLIRKFACEQVHASSFLFTFSAGRGEISNFDDSS